MTHLRSWFDGEQQYLISHYNIFMFCLEAPSGFAVSLFVFFLPVMQMRL